MVKQRRPASDEAAAPVPRYTALQRQLHWLMALLVGAMLALGWNMARLPLNHPAKGELIAWHQVIGMTILALWVLRVWQRRRHGRPDWPVPMPGWRAGLAVWNQRLLYVLLLGMPLAGIGISLLDPFVWPHGANPPASRAQESPPTSPLPPAPLWERLPRRDRDTAGRGGSGSGEPSHIHPLPPAPLWECLPRRDSHTPTSEVGLRRALPRSPLPPAPLWECLPRRDRRAEKRHRTRRLRRCRALVENVATSTSRAGATALASGGRVEAHRYVES